MATIKASLNDDMPNEVAAEEVSTVNVTDIALYPAKLAMYGSSNDEIKHSLHVRADWVIYDLLRATVKTALLCIVIIIKRRWGKLWQR